MTINCVINFTRDYKLKIRYFLLKRELTSTEMKGNSCTPLDIIRELSPETGTSGGKGNFSGKQRQLRETISVCQFSRFKRSENFFRNSKRLGNRLFRSSVCQEVISATKSLFVRKMTFVFSKHKWE